MSFSVSYRRSLRFLGSVIFVFPSIVGLRVAVEVVFIDDNDGFRASHAPKPGSNAPQDESKEAKESASRNDSGRGLRCSERLLFCSLHGVAIASLVFIDLRESLVDGNILSLGECVSCPRFRIR